jgi:NAD(P)-dependent dehydrogenase (short-subunit alcohol dehydrogenase family)
MPEPDEGGQRHMSVDDDPALAVVAGGSRGLGLLICRELARRGYEVHTCARSQDELDQATAQLADEGLSLTTAICDVRDAAQVRDWIARVGPDRIQVAIHVAGIIQVAPAATTTVAMYEDAIGTMLLGPVHLLDAVLGPMRAAGRGRTGVVSSLGGVVSAPRLVPYGVAKFGARGLSEGLYAELAGTGVTCSTIVPGLMRTGAHTHARFLRRGQRDYDWFAVAASLPLLSVDAGRAARRIVDGVLAGKPWISLTPLAWCAVRAHGLAPGLTIRLTGLVSRCLPKSPGSGEERTDQLAPGATLRRESPRLVRMLSVLGDRAARRNNE